MTRIADLAAQLDTLARILGDDTEITLAICDGDGMYLADTIEVTTLTRWRRGEDQPRPPVALLRGHVHDDRGQRLPGPADPPRA